MTKETDLQQLIDAKKNHGANSPEYKQEYKSYYQKWGKPGRGLKAPGDHTNGSGGSSDSNHKGMKRRSP